MDFSTGIWGVHFYIVFTVKVTGKNSKGKKLSKSLKCTVTVKDPSIKLDKTALSLAVGETDKLTATVAPKSAADTVTYTSSDEAVATVANDGTVTAVAEGEATITATETCGTKKPTVTATVTVKKYGFKSVKQTKANTLEAVIAGDTKSIKAADITISNKTTNVVKPVKTVSVDANDATKVTIETFADINDGNVYAVTFDGTVQEFTATDGTVASVGLDKTEVAPNTDTPISAELKDANGVLLDTVAYPGNGTVTIDFTVDYNDGYPTANGIFLYEKGKTATADITYHSGKYDETTGAETGNVEAKGIVITAGDAATISGWKVKVGKNDKTKFDDAVESKLAVDDENMAAYIQTTDSKGATSVDITGYTVESSDPDALIVGTVDGANGKVDLTPVKAGTSYLVVKDSNGKVVVSIPVVVDAKRKATTLTLDKTAITLTKGIVGEGNESADIAVTLKDQYGENITEFSADFATLSYNNGSTTVKDNTAFDSLTVSEGKISVSSTDKDNGTYTVKITVEGLVRTFTVKVQNAADAEGATPKLELSATSADAVLKADMADNTTITAKVYMVKNGVKASNVTSHVAAVTLTDSANNAAKLKAPATTTSGAVEINAVDSPVSGSSITIKVADKATGAKLAAGTYKLTVTYSDKQYSATIRITDSQSAVSVKRVKTSGTSLDECYEFTYDGKKVDTVNYTNATITYYKSNGEQIAGTGTFAVSYAVVEFELSGEVKIVQKVSIGNTVTIN